jgi:cystathionine beta-lyase
MGNSGKRTDTRVVRAGRRKEWLGGLVNVPVARTSTVLFEDVEAMHSAYPPRDGQLSYGRNGTPTQWSLAEALTELEPGAAGTKLFPSGAAAVAMALMAVLGPGDELLMVDSAYGPTRRFCDDELARLGVTTRYYDPRATVAEVEALASGSSRAIFMESPGSLTFEVQDVPGICAMARQRGIITLLDNTWATPLLFPALSHGVDLSILACTKYVSGHSDVMLGSVTSGDEHWPALQNVYARYGQHVGADDAYLAARGLRTMAVRLRQHEASALQVAGWLAEQAQVAELLHPAFESCPGHAFWRRDFRGSSGLFGFTLRGAPPGDAARLVEALDLFGIGYSWGGFESLAIPVDLRRIRTAAPPELSGALVRLHIGLEDPADLIDDLQQALAKVGG